MSQRRRLPAGLALPSESTPDGEEEDQPQAKKQKLTRRKSSKGGQKTTEHGDSLYESLGHGRCGDVVLADSENGPVAVKFAPSSSEIVPELQHEAAVYESLKHLQGDAIPRLFRTGPLAGGRFYGLCMEVVGVNLVRALRAGVDKEYLKQGALKALAKLHAARFLHRDIRLENICYNAETCRVSLVDLGFAQALEHEEEMVQERRSMIEIFK